jgi:hypothetical protein
VTNENKVFKEIFPGNIIGGKNGVLRLETA